MNAAIDFLLVGKGPLGSALRAAVLGVLAVTLGRIFLDGWWPPMLFGLVVCFAILPVAYMISTRDDGTDVDPYLATQDERPPGPAPRDLYTEGDKPGPDRQ